MASEAVTVIRLLVQAASLVAALGGHWLPAFFFAETALLVSLLREARWLP